MIPVNGTAGKGALDQLPQRKYAQAPERERIAKEARAHDIGNRYQNQHPQAVLPLLAHQDERVHGILPRGEPDEGAQREPVAFQQERQDAKADKRGDRGLPKPQKQEKQGDRNRRQRQNQPNQQLFKEVLPESGKILALHVDHRHLSPVEHQHPRHAGKGRGDGNDGNTQQDCDDVQLQQLNGSAYHQPLKTRRGAGCFRRFFASFSVSVP